MTASKATSVMTALTIESIRRFGDGTAWVRMTAAQWGAR